MSRELVQNLKIITSDPRLHARWLNTFSYLEYVGFRKIVKSQTNVTLEILQHAVEEGRHALQLKRLALQIGGRDFETYEPETLLCGEAAEAYFHNLDGAIHEKFSTLEPTVRTRLTYLYVTTLVELRALEIYRAYQSFGDAASLRGLLAEEENHLETVEGELAQRDAEFRNRLHEFRVLEAGLYSSYVSALSNELRGERVLDAVH